MYEPRFTITTRLLRSLTEAAELRAWIERSIIDVAWVPLLQRDTANRLSHSSTSIEGNPLSLSLVEAVGRGEEIGAPAKAVIEVKNYMACLEFIWTRSLHSSIGEKELLCLHARLMKGLLPDEKRGHYKTVPNKVVDARQQPIYIPPGPEQAHTLTSELLEWVNSPETRAEMHPVLLSGIAHHRLVSIHPFSDGNGRISRLLGCWLLYRGGFDPHHFFAVDEYYDQDREKYYAKLQQARDLDNDLSDWLEYVALGIVATLQKTKNRIESLDIQHAAARIRLTPRQETLLRILRGKAKVPAAELAKGLGVSRERMSELLRPLIEAGIVIREGKTRAILYSLKK